MEVRPRVVGSIPACAGEAIGRNTKPGVGKVYPRVCGGSRARRGLAHLGRGLSPRVRGKPALAICRCAAPRSIPACAGEARRAPPRPGTQRVYPRVCGGSAAISVIAISPSGLSPRVRGKPLLLSVALGLARSIPACAGEAATRGGWPKSGRVYPRVCGGSYPAAGSLLHAQGLSPRVRGKRRRFCVTSGAAGSIPACAGEATQRARGGGLAGVYPRVCGGSNGSLAVRDELAGLSPRVRGKRAWTALYRSRRRSIPACAGEAPEEMACECEAEVYPRVCGGSGQRSPPPPVALGLSPRVRGKPDMLHAIAVHQGSIPACAGEALGRPGAIQAPEVYPRVCGGSIPHAGGVRRNLGLSPRVRGKPGRCKPAPARPRSIPACAGEADIRCGAGIAARVYPRVCGGSGGPVCVGGRV